MVCFVGEEAVQEQVSKAVVADVAVEQEKKTAVPIKMGDLFRELETPLWEVICNRIADAFTGFHIHYTDGFAANAVEVGGIFNGKLCAIV